MIPRSGITLYGTLGSDTCSLVLPFALGAAGALAGTISCSIAGAQGMPLVGAAIGAGCALVTELVR